MIPDTIFTLAAAKAHLRVPHNDEDTLITAYLDAAVDAVERATRRALTIREWETPIDACDVCGCDSWTFHALLSPAQPIVYQYLPDGSAVEVDAAKYHVSTCFGSTVVRGTTWPQTVPTVGPIGLIGWLAEPEAPPPALYAAVLEVLGDLYENREAQVAGIPIVPNRMVDKLIQPYVLDMHV